MKIPVLSKLFARPEVYHWILPNSKLQIVYTEHSRGVTIYDLAICDLSGYQKARAIAHRITPEVIEIPEGNLIFFNYATTLKKLAKENKFDGLSLIVSHLRSEKARRLIHERNKDPQGICADHPSLGYDSRPEAIA